MFGVLGGLSAQTAVWSPSPSLRIPKGIQTGLQDCSPVAQRQEPGTGTGAGDLTRRGPVARQISGGLGRSGEGVQLEIP